MPLLNPGVKEQNMIKRLTTDKQRENIKKAKKYKGKSVASMSKADKDALIELMAKKLNLL